jgi:hypothetical protein
MELEEIRERLTRLDADKQIDIVKNYRQYGYSNEIRDYVIELLDQKGITRSDLQLTGNMENSSYNYVEEIYFSYRKNSILALTLYCCLIVWRFVLPWMNASFSEIFMLIVGSALLIFYLVCLFRSFQDQSEFYKATGDPYGSDGALVYLAIGLPFYFVMYFFFLNQMKERLKTFS